nr:hypothetical protein PJ912_03015 [Pectobacterium colocasium]
MMNLDDLKKFLEHPELKELIEQVWDSVGQEFLQAQINLPAEIAMPRKEISFHEQVKLLGYLCWLVSDLPGDIIEIGVWKGRFILIYEPSMSKKSENFWYRSYGITKSGKGT